MTDAVGPVPRAALSSLGVIMHRLGRLGGRRPSVRILYYHSIGDLPIRSSVNVSAFESQIAHLRSQRYSVLSLSDAVQRLAIRAPLPERSVVITLDDGFRDNYEAAFPILTRFAVSATIFLTVSYIGTDRLPTLTRTEFVPRPLTWEQVREMHADGIEFGSHTLTHPMLARVPPDRVRRELSESKRIIEDKLGAPARLFCYPRGDFNVAVQDIVREQGYAAACTTLPGTNSARTDPMSLRRTYVSRRDTLAEFEKKLQGGYDVIQRLARLAARVRGH